MPMKMIAHADVTFFIITASYMRPRDSKRGFKSLHIEQDAREAMRVVFCCTYKMYLYAQNEISYEYIQILF